MLACFKMYSDEEETTYAITRGLTKYYETESGDLLRQPGTCRTDVESILRERHQAVKRNVKPGRQHALFAGLPCRGGRPGGGRGGYEGGHGKATGEDKVGGTDAATKETVFTMEFRGDPLGVKHLTGCQISTGPMLDRTPEICDEFKGPRLAPMLVIHVQGVPSASKLDTPGMSAGRYSHSHVIRILPIAILMR